jgi:hypothetical protein|tara:strand:- start:12545 stop:12772 length:228 start_codon:yes stop_codon:yes gene_type:complete
MVSSEYLYESSPDRLLVSDEVDVWYAFYDDELSVLSNSTGELVSYSYQDKSEYREVRRFIVEEYPVRDAKGHQYD